MISITFKSFYMYAIHLHVLQFNIEEIRCYSSAGPPLYSTRCVRTQAGKNVMPPTIRNPRKACSCNMNFCLKHVTLQQSNDK